LDYQNCTLHDLQLLELLSNAASSVVGAVEVLDLLPQGGQLLAEGLRVQAPDGDIALALLS
jgi:hypothetical protein